MHTTLKQLWMVFVIPIMIGVVLAASGYIGTPRNKGIWIEPQVPLSYYTTTEPNSHYQWTVLYPCQNCEQSTALRNAITTLGTKQSLVRVLIPTTLHEVDEQHFYLADPHQMLILKYPIQDPLAVVNDLKRLLKSVSQ